MFGPLALPDGAALAFLPAATVIGVWIAWTDMASMRIPNKAVLALLACFLLIAPFVLPLPEIGWRLLAMVGVLIVGFLLSASGLLGAGDAKYLAVMAAYVDWADAGVFGIILAAAMVAAFITHRSLRAIGPVRRVTQHWTSWTDVKFPLGLALGPALALYLAMAALPG